MPSQIDIGPRPFGLTLTSGERTALRALVRAIDAYEAGTAPHPVAFTSVRKSPGTVHPTSARSLERFQLAKRVPLDTFPGHEGSNRSGYVLTNEGAEVFRALEGR